MANPPYHPPGGPASPVPERETAKRGPDGLAGAWIERLAAALRHRGTLTLIVSAWMIPACLGAMARSRCPCSVIFPLWPKTGRAAKLVLLRGIRNGAAPMRLSHGLVLHSAGGGFTDVAEAVLRDGAKLEL
jgi:tRNA1(Val) A37 N6-methylase TrmN6